MPLQAITGTCIDGSGNPNTTGTVSLHLLVPGGGLAIQTSTGDLINIDPPNPTPDPTTAVWIASVIAPGSDITPPGCEWQVTQGPGNPIVSPSFAYAGGTINVTTWIASVSRYGMVKMWLKAITGSAMADTGATFGVTINTDCIWTGTGGSGQLIQAGAPPITTVVDSGGNVFYYLIPQASLNPSTGYYQTPTRTRALYFICPATYGAADKGTWLVGTTYAIGDIVQDPANNYEPYISLAAGNIGHVPSTTPADWADYAGVEITLHETVPEVPGTRAITTAGIAYGIRAVTASTDTATTADDAIDLDGTSNTVTETLPSAAGWNKFLVIKCINVTHAVTINTTGGQTIDGASSLTPALNVAYLLYSNGSNWLVAATANIGGGGSVFVASGSGHAAGIVPDPGATAGTTKFLREDATWVVPAGGGSSAFSWATKTTTYTITTADSGILADATSAAFTVTLPTAVGLSQQFTVKKKDSAAHNVTVACTGGQTIDGASTAVISTQYASLTFGSDNANWFIL